MHKLDNKHQTFLKIFHAKERGLFLSQPQPNPRSVHEIEVEDEGSPIIKENHGMDHLEEMHEDFMNEVDDIQYSCLLSSAHITHKESRPPP